MGHAHFRRRGERVAVKSWAVVLVLVLLGVPAGRSPWAQEGAATEYIRARIEKVYDLVGAAGSVEAMPPDRRAAARRVLDEMFDWTEMGKRALDRHWGERSAAERSEFVGLFAELFQRTYLSRIQVADRTRFQYLGESGEGDRTVVKTKIVTRKGREIAVNYLAARRPGDRWMIDDLDIAGVSLVNNYRAQFTTLIERSSYRDFVDKLRALVDRRPAAAPDDAPVLVGAGDIAACVSDGDEATARLLDAIAGVVFTLGDNAYEAGTSIEFAACYDPSWGRHTTRTRPAPGNHDYLTPGASDYFDYFGAAAGERGKGYYSYDVGLAGHDHVYERMAPQSPGGDADPARGLRQFVVGTGGASHHRFAGPPVANSEVRNDDTFGVLKLTLRPASYDWQFVPVAGRTFTDSGTGRCH